MLMSIYMERPLPPPLPHLPFRPHPLYYLVRGVHVDVHLHGMASYPSTIQTYRSEPASLLQPGMK